MEEKECKKYPFDDDYMVYDYVHHRYVLTLKCVFDELGINLSTELNNIGDANNTAIVKRVLLKATRTLYSWIYAHGGINEWQEWVMAIDPTMRDNLKEMLLITLEYLLTEGDIGARSGVNINKGTVISRDDLNRAQVPIEVEQIANKLLPCWGRSILYRGIDVCVPCHAYRRGY